MNLSLILVWFSQGPHFAPWRYMCDKKYSRRFVEGLIDSFLTEEIIPDILIDVFSGEKFLVSIMAHTFVISFLNLST